MAVSVDASQKFLQTARPLVNINGENNLGHQFHH